MRITIISNGNSSFSASHHWSQLWALHPHLLQVTWPQHRLPIGLLTWVTGSNEHKTLKCKYNISIIYIISFFCIVIFCTSSSSLFLSAGCDCQSEFSDGTCEDLTGRCFCKPNYTGENCDSCASGFTNFPDCYCEYQTKTTVTGHHIHMHLALKPLLSNISLFLCVHQPSPPPTTTAKPNLQERSSVRKNAFVLF